MTTNLHYLIAGMAVLLVVLWQYSHQRQMDDRNSLMFRRLLTVVSLDVLLSWSVHASFCTLRTASASAACS